ncbi:MAG TPA: hypothetical protein VEI82_08610 [Myxococcota bacterium]|nr:hypothetical protein [Myxococcota bacterium]
MFAVALVRLALFLAAPLDQQIGLIPDDAFYYLVPARHFAELGRWTFDGVAPATGFHLLYGYALAGLFRVAPQLDGATLFGVVAGAGTLAFAAAVWAVARAAVRDFGAPAALGVALAFTAPVALRQPTLLVESCLVLLFSSALLALLSRAGEPPELGPRGLAAALALGLLGNLARSDFGLLPAAGAAVFWALGRRAQARLALAATLGAALGVVAVSLHTLHWSGSVIQSSARMKQHWSALLGYDPRGLLRWLVDVVAPRDARWLGARSGALLVLAAGALGAWTQLGARALRLDHWPLAVACALTIAGYLLFYGAASSGVPPWYLANALAPLAYLMGGVTSFLPRRARVPALAIAVLCAALDTAASLRPFLPHQVAMKDAGLYLRDHPEVGLAAAWNAGVVAYFSGRPVVNLDGLVNDDIYAAAVSGKLLDYVCRRGVRAVVDYAEMIQNPELALRGGHADGRLHALLHGELDFTKDAPGERWHDTDLWLWRFDRSGCGPGEASAASE